MSGGHAHHLSFESIVADAIVFVLYPHSHPMAIVGLPMLVGQQ